VVRAPSDVLEVLDRVLDRGIVIDAWLRVSVVGLTLVDIDARVVVASFRTYVLEGDTIAGQGTGTAGRAAGRKGEGSGASCDRAPGQAGLRTGDGGPAGGRRCGVVGQGARGTAPGRGAGAEYEPDAAALSRCGHGLVFRALHSSMPHREPGVRLPRFARGLRIPVRILAAVACLDYALL